MKTNRFILASSLFLSAFSGHGLADTLPVSQDTYSAAANATLAPAGSSSSSRATIRHISDSTWEPQASIRRAEVTQARRPFIFQP